MTYKKCKMQELIFSKVQEMELAGILPAPKLDEILKLNWSEYDFFTCEEFSFRSGNNRYTRFRLDIVYIEDVLMIDFMNKELAQEVEETFLELPLGEEIILGDYTVSHFFDCTLKDVTHELKEEALVDFISAGFVRIETTFDNKKLNKGYFRTEKTVLEFLEESRAKLAAQYSNLYYKKRVVSEENMPF